MEYFDAIIVHVGRKTYSHYGNPIYKVIYRKVGSEIQIETKTQPNYGFVYGVVWHNLNGKYAKISLTKSGNIEDLKQI
jgi:hypothetical protein